MVARSLGKTTIVAALCGFLAAWPAAAETVSGPASSVISDQAIEHVLGTVAAKPAASGQIAAQTVSRDIKLNFGPFHFQETERMQAKFCS